jgi:hypothetical protein
VRTIDAMIIRLETKNVGVSGSTIFAGSDINIPVAGDPPLLTLAEAGGPEPTRFHNTASLRHPTIQVTSRGDIYDDVAALLDNAWNALGGDEPIVNVTIGDVFFLTMHPIGEIMQLPVDANQRVRLVFNVAMTRR